MSAPASNVGKNDPAKLKQAGSKCVQVDCQRIVAKSLESSLILYTTRFFTSQHKQDSACLLAHALTQDCVLASFAGDECMYGPYRTKLLEMGALGGLLRAALTSVMDEECDMVVQQVMYGIFEAGLARLSLTLFYPDRLQAAAIGIMYLSTMAGALEPSELAMYSALLMDSDNSEMIEFLMAGMWILLRSPENRRVCVQK
eukprot:1159965-Pelagomonas_calceolata.AAC.5